MVKLLEVKTEDVNAIKTLFEVLKDVLGDINMEFRRDDKMNLKALEENNKLASSKNNDDDDDIDIDEEDDKKNKDGKTKKGGIKILATDEKKTLLIDVKLDAENFSTFWCKKKEFDIGISVTQLYKFLKYLDKDDILTMSMDTEDKLNIVLKVDNAKKNYDTIYRLKLQDIDKIQYKPPQVQFDVVIHIDTSEFHRVCREMNTIANYMEIKCTRKAITFTCKGDCSDRSTTYYNIDSKNKDGKNKDDKDEDEPRGVSIRFAKNPKAEIIQGIYKLENLVMFTKCASLCNEIEIYMKNSYPICIKYTVATLGRINFCLSPYNARNIDRNFDDNDEFYDDKEIKLKE